VPCLTLRVGNNFHLPQSEIDKLASDPEYLMARRKYVEHELQGACARCELLAPADPRAGMFVGAL
jgi:hypothetical protein